MTGKRPDHPKDRQLSDLLRQMPEDDLHQALRLVQKEISTREIRKAFKPVQAWPDRITR